MMSDSDERSEMTEGTREAIREMAPEVEELLQQGHVLLTGPASVQLVIRAEDAATPQEAVELVIRKIAHVGLDTFTFAVTDMLSGENYFVQAGQLISLGEIETTIKAAEKDDEQT